MAIIIDGKKTASDIRLELKKKVDDMVVQYKKRPCLAVFLVGDNPASKLYVKNKQKACDEIGIASEMVELSSEISQESLEYILRSYADRRDIDGMLLQLPLPSGLDTVSAIGCIPADKDVDAFNPSNVGKMFRGDYDFLPCTPQGVIELLDRYNIEIEGKDCVVVGRSNIVGRPMASMLLNRNATVTICHSKTKDLADITKRADILVVAIGSKKHIKADMIKDGAVVIDVGINRDDDGKLCGDVDFENVSAKASYITPVPGGVGPMTVAMLMKNTVYAAEKKINKS